MKAEGIRSVRIVGDEIPTAHMTTSLDAIVKQAILTREIAAQLAEMNEKLVPIVDYVKMLSHPVLSVPVPEKQAVISEEGISIYFLWEEAKRISRSVGGECHLKIDDVHLVLREEKNKVVMRVVK